MARGGADLAWIVCLGETMPVYGRYGTGTTWRAVHEPVPWGAGRPAGFSPGTLRHGAPNSSSRPIDGESFAPTSTMPCLQSATDRRQPRGPHGCRHPARHRAAVFFSGTCHPHSLGPQSHRAHASVKLKALDSHRSLSHGDALRSSLCRRTGRSRRACSALRVLGSQAHS